MPARRSAAAYEMFRACVGLIQTAIGIATGAFDALHLRSSEPVRLDEHVVMYSPRRANPTTLVVVAPPLFGTHRSPNVASVVRACLSRGWVCAVHNRPDDPQNVFGNTESLVTAFRLARRSVPDSVSLTGVVGLSTGSFQAARCLRSLAGNGAGAVVLMANALTLARVERQASPGVAAYLCKKISARLGVPCPESYSLSRLCASVGVPPGDLDCSRFLLESRVPTLCINSMNDPAVCGTVVPALSSIASRNRNVRVWVTANGGHLGWVGVLGRRYAIQRALDFVAGVRA